MAQTSLDNAISSQDQSSVSTCMCHIFSYKVALGHIPDNDDIVVEHVICYKFDAEIKIVTEKKLLGYQENFINY